MRNTGTIWRFACPCGREHELKRPVVSADFLNDAWRRIAALEGALVELGGDPSAVADTRAPRQSENVGE